MKIKSQKDFWAGLMFIVVGLGFSYGALEYNFGSSARPGPAYFPFGLGLLLGILGAIVSRLVDPTETAVLTIGSWAVFIKGLNLTIPLWPAFVGS